MTIITLLCLLGIFTVVGLAITYYWKKERPSKEVAVAFILVDLIYIMIIYFDWIN
ncbi:hypothetical protein [Candidatus Enterococcus ferrettii]|uniref:Uncharacterized protein n=1 Tax=Candidatus Enterococcus ferrettii TaxID=2815324 RepID=A0ABV0EN72_9ENTE|nr:hypothetical protein [Enterococcus sp. 665A]MBO1339064.1 hypothetical protein [Enterococcus sp. 665A]